MEMVEDTEYRIEGLYDSEGDLFKLQRPIRLSEELDLIPENPFEGEKPDDEDFEGFYGDVGFPPSPRDVEDLTILKEGAPMTHCE